LRISFFVWWKREGEEMTGGRDGGEGFLRCFLIRRRKMAVKTVLLLGLAGTDLLGLGSLVEERLVDVGNHSSSSNGGLDQGVQLLISANGKLQMTGGDTLDVQITGSIASQLEHLGAEVLADGGHVHRGGGSDTPTTGHAVLEMTVDTTDRELKAGTHGTTLRRLLLLIDTR